MAKSLEKHKGRLMRYKLAQVILAVSVISQPTLYQANAQSPPAGSYTKNCGRMAVNGPLLTAVCTSDGRMGPVQVWPMFSLVGYSRCIGDIAFVNGKLSCNLPPLRRAPSSSRMWCNTRLQSI